MSVDFTKYPWQLAGRLLRGEGVRFFQYKPERIAAVGVWVIPKIGDQTACSAFRIWAILSTAEVPLETISSPMIGPAAPFKGRSACGPPKTGIRKLADLPSAADEAPPYGKGIKTGDLMVDIQGPQDH